jgi:hypothetical protein
VSLSAAFYCAVGQGVLEGVSVREGRVVHLHTTRLVWDKDDKDI